MGHCTDYIVADKKKDIMRVAQDFAFYNTDRHENPSGSYHNNLDVLENKIYEDYDSACMKAEELEVVRGSYNDLIPFYESIKQEPTKQMQNLTKRLEKIIEDKCEYDDKHSIKNLSSKLITCKHCESKLAKDFLQRNNRCPVCGKDLRSQYILDRIKKYDEDYKKIDKQLFELQKKRNKKGPIKWLVKVEVHC